MKKIYLTIMLLLLVFNTCYASELKQYEFINGNSKLTISLPFPLIQMSFDIPEKLKKGFIEYQRYTTLNQSSIVIVLDSVLVDKYRVPFTSKSLDEFSTGLVRSLSTRPYIEIKSITRTKLIISGNEALLQTVYYNQGRGIMKSLIILDKETGRYWTVIITCSSDSVYQPILNEIFNSVKVSKI